jgi:hypothetical protein
MSKFPISSCLLVLAFAWMPLGACTQILFGVKFGLSTIEVKTGELMTLDEAGIEQYGLTIQSSNYGVHGGFMLQVFLGNLFIQPEVLFNSNSIDFRARNLANGTIEEDLKNENYQNIDVPIMVGSSIGPLRVGLGPVGHIHLRSSSEFFDYPGYEQEFEEITYGWQAGLGVDLWNAHIGLRYEGNFDKFGQHMVFHGRAYTFDNPPRRFILSLGITF